ncbi:putative ABC transport system permease protein [Pseudarcicella hirudinis]|uniref:Putative ABC transport system permease protein n=1 Tax=Pseudarcicella hirudinis TaxID=1079859 RepID=A0A1I5TZ87_9BACT|nr:ABC transporter permease [Pseudarcicella hirudinis]SFP87937.1 putative ABC transport system permease protein [Pseudarcicella hirudinis]
MFKNYLKITFAVLKRRKFFTFISLFGISFTLMILVVLTAFVNHLVSPGYPETKRDRCLYIDKFEQIDTLKNSRRSGPVSFHYIKNYVSRLTSPERIGFSSFTNSVNAYVKQTKVNLFYKYTDANFWKIADFEFLEGKPFTEQNIANNDFVIVINDFTRDKYFGKGVSVVGKNIEIDNVNYRIIGVVRGCPITRTYVSSDVYMPYNTSKKDYMRKELAGEYIVLLLAKDAGDLPEIKAEYQSLIAKLPFRNYSDKWFKPNKIHSTADTFIGSFLSQLTHSDGDAKKHYVYLILIGFALLFMSLPAINLINVNISRIMERASEIGIRKAFGASSRTLTYQFVIENVILTLIGGVIALLLSFGVIYYINNSGMIPYADLTINWKVFLTAVIISLLFGLLSGVYPAWRMSKLQVVQALKGGE